MCSCKAGIVLERSKMELAILAKRTLLVALNSTRLHTLSCITHHATPKDWKVCVTVHAGIVLESNYGTNAILVKAKHF